MRDRGAGARRLGHQVERRIIIIADRRERPIHIGACAGIAGDGNPPYEQPRDGAGQGDMLAEGLPGEPRPKHPDAFARQTGPGEVPVDLGADRGTFSRRTDVAKKSSTLSRLPIGSSLAAARRRSVLMCSGV